MKCIYVIGSVALPANGPQSPVYRELVCTVSGSDMLNFVHELNLCNIIDQSVHTHLNKASVFQVKVKMYLRINLTETETDGFLTHFNKSCMFVEYLPFSLLVAQEIKSDYRIHIKTGFIEITTMENNVFQIATRTCFS